MEWDLRSDVEVTLAIYVAMYKEKGNMQTKGVETVSLDYGT